MTNVSKLPARDTTEGYVAIEVRAQMSRRGVTQKQLGAVLGLTQAAISRRLTGDIPFDTAEIGQVSAMFGIHPGALFPDYEGNGPRSDGGIVLSDAEQRIILALRGSTVGAEGLEPPTPSV